MANENLSLYVASYADASAAEADFKSLKAAEARGGLRGRRRGRRHSRRRR